MRIRWIIAAILVLVGAVWIGQGWGSSTAPASWTTTGSGPSSVPSWSSAGVVVGWTAVRARPPGLSQAVQVGSAAPDRHVVAVPGERQPSSRVSASSRLTIPASSRLR